MDKGLLSTLTRAYVLNLLARGAEIAFFVILLSVFSIEQVGIYGLGIAVSAFFAIAMDMGLNQILIRDFSKRAIGIEFALKGSLTLRIPLILIGIVVLVVWGQYWKPVAEMFWVVTVAAVIQIFIAAETFCFAWLHSNSRQNVANALSIMDSIGRLLVLGITYLFLDVENALGLLIGVMTLHVPLLLLSAAIVKRSIGQEEIGSSLPFCLDNVKKRLLWPGMVFGFIGLITVTQNRMDWLMVSYYVGQVELANYSVANKAYEILMIISGIAMTTLYPWLCKNPNAAVSKKLNTVSTGVLAAGVAMALGGALFLPQILEWGWGEKYQSASNLVRFLLPVAVLSVAIMILYYRLISISMEGSLLKVSIFATLLQLGVNFVAIPSYGALGAVMGMAALAVFNLAAYFTLALRLGVINSQVIFRQLGFMLLMFFVSIILANFDLSMLVTLALFCGSCVFSWVFVLLTPRERKWVRAYVGVNFAQRRMKLRIREV